METGIARQFAAAPLSHPSPETPASDAPPMNKKARREAARLAALAALAAGTVPPSVPPVEDETEETIHTTPGDPAIDPETGDPINPFSGLFRAYSFKLGPKSPATYAEGDAKFEQTTLATCILHTIVPGFDVTQCKIVRRIYASNGRKDFMLSLPRLRFGNNPGPGIAIFNSNNMDEDTKTQFDEWNRAVVAEFLIYAEAEIAKNGKPKVRAASASASARSVQLDADKANALGF